jgi:hypothetical protein
MGSITTSALTTNPSSDNTLGIAAPSLDHNIVRTTTKNSRPAQVLLMRK